MEKIICLVFWHIGIILTYWHIDVFIYALDSNRVTLIGSFYNLCFDVVITIHMLITLIRVDPDERIDSKGVGRRQAHLGIDLN